MQGGFVAEKSLGYFKSTAVDTATSLATIMTTVPLGTALLIISAETQAIRWRDDGVDPTATIGYPLAAGAELRYTARDLSRLRFISQVNGALLNIVCYSQGAG